MQYSAKIDFEGKDYKITLAGQLLGYQQTLDNAFDWIRNSVAQGDTVIVIAGTRMHLLPGNIIARLDNE